MEDYKAIFYSKKCDGKRGGHTVDELKVICRALNLKVSGTKQVLCDQLTEYFSKQESQTALSVPGNESKKKVAIKTQTRKNSFSGSKIENNPIIENGKETKVVNVKVDFLRKGLSGKKKYNDLYEWNKDSDNLYIGRKGVVFITAPDGEKKRFPDIDSILHNPFKIGKDGVRDRDEACDLYRDYLNKKLEEEKTASKKPFTEELKLAKGKNLGCWCYPERCHGNEILKVLEKLNDFEADNDSGRSTSGLREESQDSKLTQIQAEIKEVNIKKTTKTNKAVKTPKLSKPEREENVDIDYQLRKKNIEFLIKILSVNTSLPIDKIKEIVLEIERGVYETSDNEDYYKQRALFIINNLNPKNKAVKNKELMVNVLNGTVNPYQLGAVISAQELMPERYIKSEIIADQKQLTKEEIKALPDGMIKCGKCKSWKTSYREIQSRSSDEPTTKHVYCHKCENRFVINQ